MFFISDDKNDNTDIYRVLDEEFSKHLVIKSKPTQDVSSNERANIDISFNKKKITNNKLTNNKLFNIKVKSKTINKLKEWHHS